MKNYHICIQILLCQPLDNYQYTYFINFKDTLYPYALANNYSITDKMRTKHFFGRSLCWIYHKAWTAEILLAWPFPRLLPGVLATIPMLAHLCKICKVRQLNQVIKIRVSFHSELPSQTSLLCRWSRKGPGQFGIRLKES